MTNADRMRTHVSPTQSAAETDQLTRVELTWVQKKIEHWIRFGNPVETTVLDRKRRIVAFAPHCIFAYVRWASNDFGTIISRIDVVRAVCRGEAYQTLPFVRPGGEILLKVDTWPKVESVLRTIDAIETLGIDPAGVAPDYWRHVHNCLAVGETPKAYTAQRHKAWLLRRKTAP
ncbi:MAG: DUF2840 domain-containing protein [Hyphomicrobiales bacterium]|nr:DUF2840 domain-containing protein [Hyphomicrobiales bacterium]